MSDRIASYLASGFLLACLFLGGASAAGAGAVANGVLQLLALLIVATVAWTRPAGSPPVLPAGSLPLLIILGGLLLWSLVQLIPLPASLWTTLPGRAPIAEGFRLLGMPLPAIPASLAPGKTIQSLLWLIPPVAAFLLAAPLTSRGRRTLALAILVGALLSMLLGAFQVLGGSGSPLRFYEITNPTAPVGFFSNKNHLATLLLCALPVAGALAGRAAAPGRRKSKAQSQKTIYAAIALFLVVGLAINRSIAGYALLLPAGFAAFLIYRQAVTGGISRVALGVLAALVIAYVGVALAGPVSREALSTKFSQSPASRQVMTERTLQAAGDHFPVGSGLGSFPQVYRTYEDPENASRAFANHAHNDYAEIALELGVPGVLLVLLFALWWARRAQIAWTRDFSGAPLARAASIMIGLVLFHSLVDYPLRTSGIAALFAVACAFLLPAPAAPTRRRSGEGAEEAPAARHLEAD
jgi:O-antigen ligase